jgi:hypothetical protein
MMTKAVALKAETQAPAPVSETAAVVTMIERLMTDPSVSVERGNQAFEFYQKVMADQARRAFDAAMADAKAEIPPIIKNKTVDFTSQKGRTNYRHEDLSEIARTVDPILSKFGLSYRFRTKCDTTSVEVTCVVSHRDGHYEETSLPAAHDHTGNKNSIQAVGSAVTYLQRYTLKIALGLSASSDDDGKKAGDGALISEAQYKELADLITETGTDLEKFLEIGKVESLSDIQANKFEAAKGMLLAKKRKLAQ